MDMTQGLPWLCLGDFNIIRGDDERNSERPRLRTAMDDF